MDGGGYPPDSWTSALSATATLPFTKEEGHHGGIRRSGQVARQGLWRQGAQGDSGRVACRLGGVTDNDAELLAEAFNIL